MTATKLIQNLRVLTLYLFFDNQRGLRTSIT